MKGCLIFMVLNCIKIPLPHNASVALYVNGELQAHRPALQNALSCIHVSSDVVQTSPTNLPSTKYTSTSYSIKHL